MKSSKSRIKGRNTGHSKLGELDCYLPLPGTEGDGFRLNGSVGDSDSLRGDLSNQFLVPSGFEMLTDDLEGSNPGSCRGNRIEGEDPELCVEAKYRGSGGINGISELAEAPRLWPWP
jgi:hypothetical protein